MKNVLKFKSILFALTMVAVAFTGCKEDKDDNKADKTSMLVEKQWQATAFTIDPAIDWFGNGTLVTNIYAQLPACAKDDLTIFRKNGTVAFDEGSSKCSANDPQTRSGLWTFNPDQSVISITEDGETDSWNILEFSNDRIKVEFTVEDEGITYTLTSTYVAKK